MRLICLCSALLVLQCVAQPSSARRKRQTPDSANDLAGSVLRELSGFLNGLTGNNIDNTPVLSARDDSIGLQPSAVVQPNAMPSISSCLADMASNFFGGLLGGGQTPTSSATSFPQQSNSILQSNAKFADSPALSSSPSDPLDRSDLTGRILNGFSAQQRGQLQNLQQPGEPGELRAPDVPVPSDVDRQRRNMEVLMKLRERHLARELAKGLSARQASVPVQLIEPQTQISQTLGNPTSGTQQILGTGPRQDSFLDTGGLNFDRFVVNEKNGFDALGSPVVGNWKKSGLQWTDGDLKLVDVKGNDVLGNDVTVRDRSIDIPVRSWWNIANRFVPLPNDRPEHPAALLAG